MPKPSGAESGGLGTGKILCLNPLELSYRWFGRRKDLVPKPFGAE